VTESLTTLALWDRLDVSKAVENFGTATTDGHRQPAP